MAFGSAKKLVGNSRVNKTLGCTMPPFVITAIERLVAEGIYKTKSDFLYQAAVTELKRQGRFPSSGAKRVIGKIEPIEADDGDMMYEEADPIPKPGFTTSKKEVARAVGDTDAYKGF